MIVDSLKRSEIYEKGNGNLKTGFELLKKLVEDNVEVGKYEAENGVYAMVLEYETKNPDEVKLENHRDYIDIQYLLTGIENIVVADTAVCDLVGEYVPDAEFYAEPENKKQNIVLSGDVFAVFFPGDGHAPGLSFNKEPKTVKKIVVKVPVEK